MESITAVIELTEKCNMGCTFCLRPSFKKESMNLKTLEKIIKHLLNYSSGRVDFIWHGGEPLLLGINFFKEIPKLQKKYNKKKILITNNIQTNGLLLSKEFAEFFGKEKFNVGTSLQGYKEIHDKSRLDLGGNPTFERIIKNIKRLETKPSAIVVLTKNIIGKEKETYNKLKHLVKGMRISECFPSGKINNKNKLLSPKEYGKSMIKFYEAWKKDVHPIDLRPITEIIKALVKGKCGGCLYSQKACNFSVIGIKSNGDFYTCMRAYPSKEFLLGNIKDNPLRKLLLKAKKDYNRRVKVLKSKDCKDCLFWNVCNGGCSQESFQLYGDLNHKSFYCEGRKMLFEHILNDLKVK